MAETWAQANARMACLDCGESNAHPYVTTKGANPGRLVRVCNPCMHRWEEWGLKPRPLMHEEEVDPDPAEGLEEPDGPTAEEFDVLEARAQLRSARAKASGTPRLGHDDRFAMPVDAAERRLAEAEARWTQATTGTPANPNEGPSSATGEG